MNSKKYIVFAMLCLSLISCVKLGSGHTSKTSDVPLPEPIKPEKPGPTGPTGPAHAQQSAKSIFIKPQSDIDAEFRFFGIQKYVAGANSKLFLRENTGGKVAFIRFKTNNSLEESPYLDKYESYNNVRDVVSLNDDYFFVFGLDKTNLMRIAAHEPLGIKPIKINGKTEFGKYNFNNNNLIKFGDKLLYFLPDLSNSSWSLNTVKLEGEDIAIEPYFNLKATKFATSESLVCIADENGDIWMISDSTKPKKLVLDRGDASNKVIVRSLKHNKHSDLFILQYYIYDSMNNEVDKGKSRFVAIDKDGKLNYFGKADNIDNIDSGIFINNKYYARGVIDNKNVFISIKNNKSTILSADARYNFEYKKIENQVYINSFGRLYKLDHQNEKAELINNNGIFNHYFSDDSIYWLKIKSTGNVGKYDLYSLNGATGIIKQIGYFDDIIYLFSFCNRVYLSKRDDNHFYELFELVGNSSKPVNVPRLRDIQEIPSVDKEKLLIVGRMTKSGPWKSFEFSCQETPSNP